jgi:hypothetical protein
VRGAHLQRPLDNPTALQGMVQPNLGTTRLEGQSLDLIEVLSQHLPGDTVENKKSQPR